MCMADPPQSEPAVYRRRLTADASFSRVPKYVYAPDWIVLFRLANLLLLAYFVIIVNYSRDVQTIIFWMIITGGGGAEYDQSLTVNNDIIHTPFLI